MVEQEVHGRAGERINGEPVEKPEREELVAGNRCSFKGVVAPKTDTPTPPHSLGLSLLHNFEQLPKLVKHKSVEKPDYCSKPLTSAMGGKQTFGPLGNRHAT